MPTMSPAPGRRKVLTFLSPKIQDILFYELRDSAQPEYRSAPAYGTAHPDTNNFPNHFLVYVTPADDRLEGNPGLQRWYYTLRRTDQEDYNYEFEGDYMLKRTYVVKREDYESSTDTYFTSLAVGTADSTFTDFDFSGENVLRIGQKELDSMFVVVQRFFVKPDELRQASQEGSQRGETTREMTLGTSASATPLNSGIVVRRVSNQTDEQVWENTEELLDLREGVFDTDIESRPGYRRTVATEFATTEPVEDTEQAFGKELVTTDADGVDAVWMARREDLSAEQALGSEVLRDLGGGVADITVDLVDDSTDADSGFLVMDSRVDPLGNGKAIKTTKSLGEYTPMVEYKYDDEVDALIKITKTVVAPGSVSPGVSAGDVTEVIPVDKWRSIQIRSQYHPSTPSGLVETYPVVEKFTYPAVLNSAEWLVSWAYAFSGASFAYAEDIALVFDVSESYMATVSGTIYRYITSNPTSIGVGTTYEVQAASYTVGFVTSWWYAGGGSSYARARARTWTTPLAVVPSTINLTPPQIPGGGLVTVDRNMTSQIPSSGTYPSGTITVDVRTRKLRMGLYEVLVKQLNV